MSGLSHPQQLQFVTAIGKLQSVGRITDQDCPVTMHELVALAQFVLEQHECYKGEPRSFIRDLLQALQSASSEGGEPLAAIRIWLENCCAEIEVETEVLH